MKQQVDHNLRDISPNERRTTYVEFINTMITPVLFLPIVDGLLIDYISFNILFILSILASIVAFMFAMKLNIQRVNR